MPLCIRNGYRELQDQLEELRQQGYFYIGEYVFAGSHNEQNRINMDAFHLWDVSHSDDLDRIVMLFADLTASKAASLTIERSWVRRSQSEDGRFLINAVKTMAQAYPAERVEDLDWDGITDPIRLIYPKPLFLTLLYHCNMLLEGHSIWILPQEEKQKGSEELGCIRQEVREQLDLELPDERAIFRDFLREEDPVTVNICELSRYLDGLRMIRQEVGEENEADCQRIEEMISSVKNKLLGLERSARMELPFASPEKTIALWHAEEVFPNDMSFGEMVSVRVRLENMLDELRRKKPDKEDVRQRQMWEYREGTVCQQIYQMETMLAGKMEEYALEWEDYLV